MEKSKNIHQRMLQVMSEVETIQKTDKKVNNQYRYVSHDAVTKALHMPMVHAGIYMSSDMVELVRDGNRVMVKMKVSFINSDNPEDRIEHFFYGEGIDTQDKGIGKAVSYAMKLAMLKTFCLDAGEDVERDSIDYQSSTKVIYLTEQQATHITVLAGNDKEGLQKMLDFFGVKNLKEIPADKYEGIVRSIEQKKKLLDKPKVETLKQA